MWRRSYCSNFPIMYSLPTLEISILDPECHLRTNTNTQHRRKTCNDVTWAYCLNPLSPCLSFFSLYLYFPPSLYSSVPPLSTSASKSDFSLYQFLFYILFSLCVHFLSVFLSFFPQVIWKDFNQPILLRFQLAILNPIDKPSASTCSLCRVINHSRTTAAAAGSADDTEADDSATLMRMIQWV